MNSQVYLDSINRLTVALKRVSTWNGTECAFGHLEQLDNGNKYNNDYVFEFYCYLSLLMDLSHAHSIKYVYGKSPNKHKFPRKPALKSNGWARFDVYSKDDQTLLYQVCAGTQIFLSKFSSVSHAPDISFQRPEASDTPTELDVTQVMDAKYSASEKPLTIRTIREFITIVVDFGCDQFCPVITFTDTNYNANCLITNGQSSDEHVEYCESRNIRQVSNFKP